MGEGSNTGRLTETRMEQLYQPYVDAFEHWIQAQASDDAQTDIQADIIDASPPSSAWLSPLRQAALESFLTLGFPTARHEDWKYTSVASLAKTPFRLAPAPPDGLTADTIPFVGLEESGPRLVFVDGQFTPALSALGALPRGVSVGSLALALDQSLPWLEPHLTCYANYQTHPFVALNTAFMRDGACVRIPPDTICDNPIQLVFVSSSTPEPYICHPRNMLLVESGSQASFVESYVSLDTNTVSLTNTVTELVLRENAVAEHYILQRQNRSGFHMATVQVHQDRDSSFTSHALALGGALSRHEINTVLAGPGSTCTLNGLYLATDQQLVDMHTRIDHTQPQCTSRELYAGVLGGAARGVFNGKIIVDQAAAKTDAAQTNKNLLLSETARINSKPQLEIFHNDVQCRHGSTTGQLDPSAVFYLRSRGIEPDTARQLLTAAFLNDVLLHIQNASIRDQSELLVQQALQELYPTRKTA